MVSFPPVSPPRPYTPPSPHPYAPHAQPISFFSILSPAQYCGLFCLHRKHPAWKCSLTGLFYREGLLAPRPTPKLEDHPLSAVHNCLFNIFAATFHIGSRSSTRNLRMRHAVVTGTHIRNLSKMAEQTLKLGYLHNDTETFLYRHIFGNESFLGFIYRLHSTIKTKGI